MGEGARSREAIAAVSERLVTLLSERIAERTRTSSDAVVLGSPAELGTHSTVRLGVCLYRIERSGQDGNHQHGERRTAEQPPDGRSSVVRRNPPLTLDLGYLVTAYAASESRDVLVQHRLLGAAMGILHDNPVLREPRSADGHADRPVRVTLESSPSEGRAWLWETFPETAYRPSAGYHVSPVVIDSRIESEVERVTERRAGVSRSE